MLMFIAATSIAYSADKVVVVPMGSSANTVGVDPSDIVSFYISLGNDEEKAVLTVPSDKKFMLTDIQGHGDVVIKEDNSIKNSVWLHDWTEHVPGQFTLSEQTVNFNSGIPFASGTALNAGNLETSPAYITISGYYF